MPGYPPATGHNPSAGYPPATGQNPAVGYKPEPGSLPRGWWLSVLGFFLPPVGIILSIIYMLKDRDVEKHIGKWILIWSVIGGIPLALYLWVLGSALLNLFHDTGPMIRGMQQ